MVTVVVVTVMRAVMLVVMNRCQVKPWANQGMDGFLGGVIMVIKVAIEIVQ